MRNRSVAAVIIFSIITLGIYAWYWFVSTKNEMNKQGAAIPTAWIWLIPLVGVIYWQWRWCGGVEKVTSGKLSQVTAFILIFVLSVVGFGVVGMAIIQDGFNKAPPPAAQLPVARIA